MIGAASNLPAISSRSYHELRLGERFGPFTELVTADSSDRLRGPVGKVLPGAWAPLGILPMITLRSLRRALRGIIPGGVLMEQRFDVHGEIPAQAAVQVGVVVSRITQNGDRLMTTFTFDCRLDERLVAVVEWTILAPPAEGGQLR